MKVIPIRMQKAVIVLRDHGYIPWRQFKDKDKVALLDSGAKLYVEGENKYFIGGYHHSNEDITKMGVNL